MKILYVCSGHYDSGLELYKGLAKYSDCDLLVQLHEDHLMQSVLDVDTSDITWGFTKAGEAKDLNYEIERIFDIKANTINIIKYPSLSLRDFKNLIINKELCKWINKNNFDAIIYYGSSLVWIQQYLFLKRKIKKIYTVHDYIVHSGENRSGGKQYDFYMKIITSIKTNNFILISKNMREEFCKYYKVLKQRTRYIKFGPFSSYNKFIRNTLTEEKHTILFFGRISPYKGIEYLIRAVELLKERYSDIKLIIAGAGDFYFDISAIKNDKHYEIYNEYISNEKLAEFMQRASFVVCPYTDATQSGVVMTAYEFEKPVIASDVGSFREYIFDQETGLIVPPKEPKELARAIEKLFNDEDLIRKMRDNIGIYKKTEFSWEKAAKEIINEIYEIIR